MSTSNLNIFVPATGTPVHVSSAYASDFQIANNSTSPVWVGGDSSVSVASGLLLNPGGATTWGGGQDLWAVSTRGSSGMVTCLFNASGSYTPGPTSIGISGTVPTAGGNYLTYLGGGNNITCPSGSLAYSNSPVTPLNFNMGSGSPGVIDTTGYASLVIQVSYRFASGITLNPGSFIHVDISQDQVGGGLSGSPTSYDSGEWLLGNVDPSTGAGYQTYSLQVPVKNSRATVAAYASGIAGLPTGVKASILAFGSNQAIDSTIYRSQSSDLLDGPPSGSIIAIPQSALGTVDTFIESKNGPATLSFAKLNGQTTQTGTCTLRVVEGGATRTIAAQGFGASTVSGAEFTVPLYLPNRPMLLETTLAVIAGSTTSIVTQ